jgi:tetratricopeptide (TPR) repeat protein
VGGDRQKAHEMAAEISRIDPVEGAAARAEIARAEKDETALEAAYLSGAAAGPQNYDAQMALAKYYASDTQKKYDLAESRAKAALKIDPGQAAAYGLLASLFAQSGRIAELDALLSQSEKNVSDDLSPFYQAARRFLLLGKELPRAESYIRKYLSQSPEAGAPDPAEAHWQLGLVLEKLGRKAEAIAEVEKALQLRPDLQDAKKDLKRMKS